MFHRNCNVRAILYGLACIVLICMFVSTMCIHKNNADNTPEVVADNATQVA